MDNTVLGIYKMQRDSMEAASHMMTDQVLRHPDARFTPVRNIPVKHSIRR
jgi:hypothetical protein